MSFTRQFALMHPGYLVAAAVVVGGFMWWKSRTPASNTSTPGPSVVPSLSSYLSTGTWFGGYDAAGGVATADNPNEPLVTYTPAVGLSLDAQLAASEANSAAWATYAAAHSLT